MGRTVATTTGEGVTVMANSVRNLEEALVRFQEVLATRNVPPKNRKYFVVWVRRFDAFRVAVLKRSFRTCGENHVVAFLKRQRSGSQLKDWQWKQAAEAIVLFLRNVIECPEIDVRRVLDLQREDSRPVVQELGPPRVDEDAPDWH